MSKISGDACLRKPKRRQSPARPRAWFLLVSLYLLAAQADADGPPPSLLGPPAVYVSYLDSTGAVVRASGGTLLRQGLVVPYSSLLGVSSLKAEGGAGKSWDSNQVIAIHPDADLALLQIADIPAYALEVPAEVRFAKDEVIWIAERLGGGAPNFRRARVRGKFSLRGPDFLALSRGAEPGSPAFTEDGVPLGVCLEVGTSPGALPYLVTSASLRNLIAGRSEPVFLDSLATPAPPVYASAVNIEGLIFRGALLVVCAQYKRAETYLDHALVQDRLNPDAHYWSAQILFEEGRVEAAAEEFLTAARADSTFHQAWHMAGAAYQRAGMLDRAIDMYYLALDADPTSALTYCNLGSIYYHLVETDAARGAFERAVRLDPAQGLAHYNLALLANEEGRSAEAESILVRLEARDAEWAERLRKALHGE